MPLVFDVPEIEQTGRFSLIKRRNWTIFVRGVAQQRFYLEKKSDNIRCETSSQC